MKKRKIKVTANQLTDADVSFISLVERGANQIPFRLLKEDNTMKNSSILDLGSLFRKSAPKAPLALQAIAVVAAKADEVAEKLKAADIEIFEKHEDAEQGAVLLATVEKADLSDVTPFTVSDDVAFLISGSTLKKGFSSHVYSEDATFADAAGAAGVYPSMYAAMDVLSEKVFSALGQSDSPETAAKSVGALITDFSSYVQELVGGLPTVAFKAYDALIAKDESPADEPEAGKPEEDEVVDGDDVTAAKDEELEAGKPDGEDVTDDDDEEGKQKAEGVDEPDAEPKEDHLKSLVESVAQLAQAVQNQSNEISSLKGDLESLQTSVTTAKSETEEQVAQIGDLARKAAEAAAGTALGGPDAADGEHRQKSEHASVASRGVQLPSTVQVV